MNVVRVFAGVATVAVLLPIALIVGMMPNGPPAWLHAPIIIRVSPVTGLVAAIGGLIAARTRTFEGSLVHVVLFIATGLAIVELLILAFLIGLSRNQFGNV